MGAPRALTLVAAAIGVVAALPAPARAADDSLVLTRGDVPGFKAGASGASVGRGAFGGAKLPRKAKLRGSSFTAGTQRVSSGVTIVGSAKAAGKALTSAGRGFKALTGVGDGARERSRSGDAVVLVRVGAALGAVRVASPGRVPSTAARGYAEALAARLRRVLAQTPWTRTLDEIRPDGTVSPATALRTFALAFGPLPGVKRPPGKSRISDGTIAMQMVAQTWDKLTPAQRVAIDKALGARHDASQPPVARASEKLTPDPKLKAIAGTYEKLYRTKLPPMDAFELEVYRSDTDVIDEKDPDSTPAEANSLPRDKDGDWGGLPPVACRITVRPQGLKSTPAGLELIMAHEVFHCMEFALAGQWDDLAYWINEGLAEWASTSVTSLAAAKTSLWYDYRYLPDPDKSTLARSYDAVGFWHRLDEVNGVGSLWGRIDPILDTEDDSAKAYDVAGGNDPAFLAQWTSGAYRLGGAPGEPWTQRRPYYLPPSKPLLPREVVFTNSLTTVPAYHLGALVVLPDGGRPLITVTPIAGVARAASKVGDFGVIEGSKNFCMGAKCVCPPGTEGEIPDNQPVGSTELALAVDGGATESSVLVRYHAMDEYCAKKKEPSGPAETNGDPHMTTLDGLHFDFQAAGEFVLARSASRDLEIQARQAEYGTSKTVTVNTQLAFRVGGRRLTVSPGAGVDDPPVVRIDGSPDALPGGESRALGDGAVAREPGDDGLVDVTWADGSTATVRPVGKWGVAARIALASGRRGKVAGLLGDFDGDAADDLADRKGKRIAYTAKKTSGWADLQRFAVVEEFKKSFFDALYDTVGDAWRVSQAESLLDYGPGQSTKTFTDRSIPKRPEDPDELSAAKRANAERICREHGVTQPGPLADCITDVAATGNAAFADDAAAAQAAALASWTRLRAGAGLTSALRLTTSADGLLHAGFTAGGTAQSVPVDALGREAAPETVLAADGNPSLFTGADGGVRAAVAEIPLDGRGSGVYQYARGAPGTAWSPLGAITNVGTSYSGTPDALGLPDGSALIVSPMAGVARIFRGAVPGDPGAEPTAALPDCYATSPALARDGATGAVWVAWVQWDCPQVGVFAQQFDPASGTLLGTPVQAPGSSWGAGRYPDLNGGERLAFSGRPGQPGVFLAYPTDDGANVRLWKAGDATAIRVPRRKAAAAHVRLAAEGAGGRLWLAWREDDRLWVQRTSPAGAPEGSPRPLDPPADADRLQPLRDVEIATRAGGLDFVLGVQQAGRPGGIWRTRVTP